MLVLVQYHVEGVWMRKQCPVLTSRQWTHCISIVPSLLCAPRYCLLKHSPSDMPKGQKAISPKDKDKDKDKDMDNDNDRDNYKPNDKDNDILLS